MLRIDATRDLLRQLDKELVVSNLGRSTFDLYHAGDRNENFYLFGAMGMASSVALGLALARPDRKVFALEGDGALLMNLGSLSTIRVLNPKNLTVVVWDNGCYESTGGQPTHVGRGVNLGEVARAIGGLQVQSVAAPDDFREAIKYALTSDGPHVVVAKVVGDGVKRKVPRTPVYFKERFQVVARAEGRLE